MTRSPNPLLLVNPPQTGLLDGFANSLVALASFVAKRAPGVEIQILDFASVEPEQLASQLACLPDLEAPLVGVTTTTASYHSALQTVDVFKRRFPSCRTVLGGHHAGPQAEVVLRRHKETVDFVVRGEGERALIELVRGTTDLSSIPGLSYRDGDDVCTNPPAERLTEAELDSLEITFRGSAPKSAPGKFEHVTYVSARGCPLKCAFCAVADQAIRMKSVSRVIEDLRFLVVDQGYRKIAIEDNFFAHSTARTLELCTAIDELRRELGVAFTWDCQTRVESMRSREVIDAMARAGCNAVYLGVESLVPEHIRYLGKSPNPERYLCNLYEVVPEILDAGIDCYVNLQFGIPAETEAHRAETFDHLARLGRLAQKHGKELTIFPMLHVVYPGTLHCDQAMAAGKLGPRQDVFEEFVKWEADHKPVLLWLGRHFAHGVGGIPLAILDGDKLRQGDFVVDTDAVLTVSMHLDSIGKLPGISVFSYERYLVGAAALRAQGLSTEGEES